MIKGIHTAADAMIPAMTKLEVVANNLANMNTTGFKRESVFLKLVKDAAVARAQGKGEFSEAQVQRVTDFSDGTLLPTGNPLDVAVQGRGFFVVESSGGPRYTRNGNFRLAQDGTLVTAQGIPVEGKSGRITLADIQNLKGSSVVIAETGEILVDNKPVDRLRIVDFAEPERLRKEGDSLFAAPVDMLSKDIAHDGTSVRQGYLEGSNVEGLEEMIAMIELTREFESNQRMIQTLDGTLEKANEAGRF
jgi:flagellar basal-body rod protein FlgG